MPDFMLIYVHINNPGMTRPNLFFKVGGTAAVVIRHMKRAPSKWKRYLYDVDKLLSLLNT
jgi:hypothetical protein